MTRYIEKKSVGLTVVLALIVVMALGLTDLTGDNEADRLVHEIGEFLEVWMLRFYQTQIIEDFL